MANRHRGEIDATLDGARRTLCLTLGALAELESAFGDADMLSLAQRFEGGRLSARDCVRIIGAGLRGAGAAISDDEVARLQAEGGAAGFVAVVAQLLSATFGAAPVPGVPTGSGAAKSPPEVGANDPFPGTR
jgi:Phage tail tube protein, GTA-gp10